MSQLELLPPHARLWLFLADQPLSQNQELRLRHELSAFTGNWKSHGHSLSAGFEILHRQIIVIAVDQQAEAPSGCSIDKAFRLLQEFGRTEQLDFFNRLLVPIVGETGLMIVHRNNIPSLLAAGTLREDQPYYDLTIEHLGALDADFCKPLNQGWVLKGLKQI
ncbi:MAG: hypothetical protein KJS92_03125 [Bacteroidetes bacterium]|nr:hypothetical protein [Bacteroidota bacterium]